jgi:cell division protein FtsI/penicillin-binding protein 2
VMLPRIWFLHQAAFCISSKITRMNPPKPGPAAGPTRVSPNRRLSIWYAVVIFIIGVIIARLFYLQVIKHDYYQQAALNDQLKQYSIAADRGLIEAHQGSDVVPLVLNQKLYTLYADPSLVTNPSDSAAKLANITHGKAGDYETLMKTKTAATWSWPGGSANRKG